jgi:molybdate transport system ATP-binding protein
MSVESNGVIQVALQRPEFDIDVALDWDDGVLVLFGRSGSGKSTLLECVLGLHASARCRILIAGSWLEDHVNGLSLPTDRRGLGWVPQSATLFPHLDVAANLRFGVARSGADESSLDRIVELLEIGSLLERSARDLSGGERSRVALGRALASGPRALLLDEPLAALDIPLRAKLLPYLLRVRDELGLPIVYITHDPDEAMLLGERVAVLDAGCVVASGPPRDVLWSQAVLPLSETLGLENVFQAEFQPEPDAGDSAQTGGRIVTRAGLVLQVPWRLEAGKGLLLGLRAEDITLSLDPPGRISARNVIPGRITRREDLANHVLVHVDAGERLVVRVTPDAARALELESGIPVFLIVKAHALRRLG